MKISHKNRYEKLRSLIMCYPCNFKVSGNVQINYPLMYEQYNKFINLMSSEGVIIQFLDPIYGANQVFTRDIGFVIEDRMFIAKMSTQDRIEETKALEKYIKDHHSKIYNMKNNIEGGDVIIHDCYIFIGLSKRTNIEAVYELQNYINEQNMGYKVIPINFNKEKMLHLDCVFNILDKDDCIISNYVYDKEEIEKIMKNCYYIDDKTTEELGTNIISLGDKKIVTSNKTVFNMLKYSGFKVFYLDYSEILKAGGGFACSILPIYTE